MRPLGRNAAARADWAHAHSQFWRGRFLESHALLANIRLDVLTPDTSAEQRLELLIPCQLSWVLALLGQTAAALEHAEHALTWALAHPDPVHLALVSRFLCLLHCFLDAPETTLVWSRRVMASAEQVGQGSANLDARLLEYWALSRLGQPTDEAAAQAALVLLRRQAPAVEARAFSIYAQALFYQSPAHALTQLDAALDLNARFGLHYWEAHLLHLKSQSLDAAGQLAEASRFHALAEETARRQGARLFLDRIAGIESRSRAGFSTE